MATAWHTPGMDSPCQLDVGESSAPVAQNRSRRSSRFSSLSSRYPHKTLAPHPQPERPRAHPAISCQNEKSAVVIDRGEVHADAPELVEHNCPAEHTEIARHDQVIVRRYPPQVAEMCLQRADGCGRHGRAHVIGVLDAVILNFPMVAASMRGPWPLFPRCSSRSQSRSIGPSACAGRRSRAGSGTAAPPRQNATR